MSILRNILASFIIPASSPFPYLDPKVLQVSNIECLMKAMGWTGAPVLEEEYLHDFDFITDLNERRIRDAEVIGVATCNGDPKVLLEIGTSHGRTTALMARNAPNGIIHTVNIPPDNISEGGDNVTLAPSLDEIGSYYRAKGCTNVHQILANSMYWEPDFGPIDVAFIDGCHDAKFVYSDTCKVLKKCRPGSIILWHDFHPQLAKVHPWINEVCKGIERLYKQQCIHGHILHLKDSWVGLYKV